MVNYSILGRDWQPLSMHCNHWTLQDEELSELLLAELGHGGFWCTANNLPDGCVKNALTIPGFLERRHVTTCILPWRYSMEPPSGRLQPLQSRDTVILSAPSVTRSGIGLKGRSGWLLAWCGWCRFCFYPFLCTLS